MRRSRESMTVIAARTGHPSSHAHPWWYSVRFSTACPLMPRRRQQCSQRLTPGWLRLSADWLRANNLDGDQA
jgi:hypothetical protein